MGWNVEKLILLSLIIANYFNFSIQQTLILQVKDDNVIVKETRFKKKKRERKMVLWWYEEITVTVNLSVINTDVVCFVKKFHCLEVNIEAFMDEMVVI